MSDESTPVTVRELRAGDLDGWLKLWAGYLAFYREELSDEITAHAFARLSHGTDGMAGLLAVDGDDRPVALAHLVFHPSTWSSANDCFLEDLYVDPSHRGGRTARVLFDAIFAEARERGCERVYWRTQQFNGSARSLYDRVGHVTSDVLYEHVLE